MKKILPNKVLATGDIAKEVNKLKCQSDKDIIVYGGASFVSGLIKNDLIDEYNLFVNPAAIGKRMQVFNGLQEKRKLKLTNCQAFDCGIVGLRYVPA